MPHRHTKVGDLFFCLFISTHIVRFSVVVCYFLLFLYILIMGLFVLSRFVLTFNWLIFISSGFVSNTNVLYNKTDQSQLVVVLLTLRL
jgi:hypothetical protein